jgi:tRNA pseudouridine55 synthase
VELERIENQFYLINKPVSWTSFDVVKKMKYLGKFKKIGHAGTLDPLATGLLIICVGKHTKKIDYFQNMPKTYTGEMVFGKTTPSIDLETEFDAEYPINHITEMAILDAIKTQFVGDIKQVPPIYSAIKLNGQRLYTLARNGVEESSIEIKIRDAHIYDFKVETSQFPLVQFEICCSKGTYIRSIVRDLGVALASGAYLNKLVRTQIGIYHLANAQELTEFDPSVYAEVQ